jgi:hypothetical protein
MEYSRIIQSVIVLIITAISFPTSANVGFYSGSGASLYLMKSEALSLDKENIVYEFAGTDDENDGGHIQASCTFTVSNTSDNPVHAAVGFPVTCEESIKQISISEDSLPVKTDKRKTEINNACTYTYVWSSDFKPKQTKTITVLYSQSFSVGLYRHEDTSFKFKDKYNIIWGEVIYFHYITSTISSWKSNVQEASFRIVIRNIHQQIEKLWESDRKQSKQFADINVGYIFTYTSPDELTFNSALNTYECVIRDFSGNQNFEFMNFHLMIPNDASAVEPYINTLKLNREQCGYLRNFYEAVHGKPFSDDLYDFFSEYRWYKPNKTYNPDAIPQKDKNIIAEFDRIIKSMKQ